MSTALFHLRRRLRRAGGAWLLAGCGWSAGAVAAELPGLETMPVRLIPNAMLAADHGRTYSLQATVAGDPMHPVQRDELVYLYASRISAKLLGVHRFHLTIRAAGSDTPILALHLYATNQRCLLTSADAVLNQRAEYGRLIEIEPVGLRTEDNLPVRLAQRSGLCTNDIGELAIHFATPAFDMLPLTVVSFGGNGRLMASASIVLPLSTATIH